MNKTIYKILIPNIYSSYKALNIIYNMGLRPIKIMLSTSHWEIIITRKPHNIEKFKYILRNGVKVCFYRPLTV